MGVDLTTGKGASHTADDLWEAVSAFATGDKEALRRIWEIAGHITWSREQYDQDLYDTANDLFLCICEYQSGGWSDAELPAVLFQTMRLSPFEHPVIRQAWAIPPLKYKKPPTSEEAGD